MRPKPAPLLVPDSRETPTHNNNNNNNNSDAADFTMTTTEDGQKEEDEQEDEPSVVVTVKPTPVQIAQILFHVTLAVLAAAVRYLLRGPPLPSWSPLFSLRVAGMRSAIKHSHIVPLAARRALSRPVDMSPDLATITPFILRVRPRCLPGVLAPLEARESGRREISGEWICDRRVFLRWTRWNMVVNSDKKDAKQQQQADRPRDRTDGYSDAGLDKVILYFHGGAYCVASTESHRSLIHKISAAANCRALGINYRLAPENPFPAALHDAVHSYLNLIEKAGVHHTNVVIAGDSAGGGLSMSLMMYLRDHNFPMPGGAVLLSPFVNLSSHAKSWVTQANFDYLPPPVPLTDKRSIARWYCGGGPDVEDADELEIEAIANHPYVSSVRGDLRDLPPILIQGGTAEVLADDIVQLAENIRACNEKSEKVDADTPRSFVELDMYEDMIHVFQFLSTAKQAAVALRKAGQFIRLTLDELRAGVPRTPLGGRFDRADDDAAEMLSALPVPTNNKRHKSDPSIARTVETVLGEMTNAVGEGGA